MLNQTVNRSLKHVTNMAQLNYYVLCNDVAISIEHAVSDLIGKSDAGKTLRIGADGTPTAKIDEVAENAAVGVLEAEGRPMRLVSEELGEKLIGKNPEFTFVLDPIDGTFNAVNNIPFFCVPVMENSIKSRQTRKTGLDFCFSF